jgi:C4-dicarboxylate transporter, DctM subunit
VSVDPDVVAVGGFAVLFALIALRVPVGIAMAVVGVGGFGLIVGLEPALRQLALTPIRTVTTHSYGLIPMFLLMGAFATASGMSREIYGAANAWLGHHRGGLAMATVAACGGFAAICGSSVATAATMTRVALPEMRAAGYSDTVATGTIGAGGTVGILIPPSIVLAIYGIITEQDIARLFIAGVVPGVLSVLLYLGTVRVIAAARPAAVPVRPAVPWRKRFASVRGVWPMALVFAFVVGGIYGGVFTPTEAAGMGAAGAFLVGAARRRLPGPLIFDCLVQSMRTTASIFLVLIGALLFGYFLAVTRTPQHLADFLVGLGLGPYPTLGLILVGYFLLGCVLDPLAMIVLTVPIVFPVILAFDFDPIWFGIIVVISVEMALITPPLGMNIYVINSVVRDVGLVTIFKGVLPFVVTDIVRLALVVAVPSLALWLPAQMG